MRKPHEPAPKAKGPAHCYLCGADCDSLDRLMQHLKRGCPGKPTVRSGRQAA